MASSSSPENSDIVKRNVHRGVRNLFKDIEISRSDIELLSAISFGITCLIIVNLFFAFGNPYFNEFSTGNYLIIGLVVGIIIGPIVADHFTRKFPVIIACLGICPIFNLWAYFNQSPFNAMLTQILLAVNLAIGIILVVLMLTLYIQYTTVLERGRVISIILSINIILSSLIIYFLLNPPTHLVPSIIPILVAIGLYEYRAKEKTFQHFTLLETLVANRAMRIARRNKRKAKKAKKNEIQEEDQSSEIMDEEDPMVTENEEPDQANSSPKNLSTIIQNITDGMKIRRSAKNFAYFLRQNGVLFKYIAALFVYGLIIGLLVPPLQSLIDIFSSNYVNPRVTYMLQLAPVLMVITAIIIGIVFDSYGRKATLSSIVLIIGIANGVMGLLDAFFTSTSSNNTDIQTLPLVVAGGFVLFLAIPLINGDLSRAEFYGRSNSILFGSAMAGILLGITYKNHLFENEVTALLTQLNVNSSINTILYDFSVTSVVFMACIVLLFILTNINYDFSRDEQHWPDALIHMYIIHNSGLLLHEHTFRAESNLAASDLISGGLMGLVSLLQEISGTKNLRIIDHGDKKLLFQFDSNRKVVFVLVIERELMVLRSKLAEFIKEFETKFRKHLVNFSGVDDSVWQPVEELIAEHFTRKYFNVLAVNST